MRRFSIIITIIVAALVIGLVGCTENVSAQTCLHSGCNRKCYSGDRYCYKHRVKTSTNKKSKTGKSTKSGSSSMKKTGPYNKDKSIKTYCFNDMPDCDDYEDWGEFMDDWDGNMPDGSDASDYWDNW